MSHGHTPPDAPPVLWDWSPQAVARFYKVAFVAGRKQDQLFLREGMNAALLEDFPLLVPALARFWITELVRADALEGRVLRVVQNETTVVIPITEKLLLRLCLLDTPAPETAPPPAPDPVPPLTGA